MRFASYVSHEGNSAALRCAPATAADRCTIASARDLNNIATTMPTRAHRASTIFSSVASVTEDEALERMRRVLALLDDLESRPLPEYMTRPITDVPVGDYL